MTWQGTGLGTSAERNLIPLPDWFEQVAQKVLELPVEVKSEIYDDELQRAADRAFIRLMLMAMKEEDDATA